MIGTLGVWPDPIGLAAFEYSKYRASSAQSSKRPSKPYSATLVMGAGTVGSRFTAAAVCSAMVVVMNSIVSILYLRCKSGLPPPRPPEVQAAAITRAAINRPTMKSTTSQGQAGFTRSSQDRPTATSSGFQ